MTPEEKELYKDGIKEGVLEYLRRRDLERGWDTIAALRADLRDFLKENRREIIQAIAEASKVAK